MKEINKIQLWIFGVWLGIKSIYKLKKINTRILEMILLPMNYWRCIETPIILNDLKPKKGELILDIGSPKLLSFYISKKIGSNMISSDVNSYFLSYCKDFSKVLGINNIYKTKIIDAQRIKLKGNSIDKAYSLSVFEHIPNLGDLNGIREVKRVLKLGGTFSLTVPYGKTSEIQYRNPKKFYYGNNANLNKMEEKVFYQRIYDEKSLKKRIINPSRMRLVKKEYVGEKSLLFSVFSLPVLSFLNLFLSKLNHSGPSKDLESIKNPCMVHLVFKK